MAGAGYGVTPMSRLSQHSSRRRPHTGKPLPNSLSKKKTPKRKTLSTLLGSKQRKLGLNTSRDSAVSLGKSQQAPEACHAGVTSKACNASEVLSKEKESRHSGTRGRGFKAKPIGKARPRGIKAEVCPIAKLLDAEDISNEEGHSSTDLFDLDAITEVVFFPDGTARASPCHLCQKT
ncbi:hypothetical protein L7F22_049721 [Adiantum nelumboides]|nr:hypothetical protein [Adiantum nelumboides]